ncbi:MAG: GNAT family N-acetyltransferase [Pseudomonadota bacterium]
MIDRITSPEIRTVDAFEEPAFTNMVKAILHDPDRQAVIERFFSPGGAPPAKSGAHQVRVGAFDADALIGWSHAWLMPGGILYVSNSGVLPERRGQGVYTRLIAAIEEEARALGCTRIESHHRTSNSAVLIAKLKAGYMIVGTEFSAEMGLLVKMCKHLEPRRSALFEARTGIVEGVVRHFARPAE